MGKQDPKVAKEAAEKFIEDNLVDLCSELMELDATGFLPDGKVRHLRRLCSFAGSSALPAATGMIQHAAVRTVASQA